MNLKYQLSKLAEKDLEVIWDYTYANWSIKKADKYINQIIIQIGKVCSNPELGRSLTEIKPEHRMLKVNSHLIIYKIEDEILKVDRILHEKMDIENRL